MLLEFYFQTRLAPPTLWSSTPLEVLGPWRSFDFSRLAWSRPPLGGRVLVAASVPYAATVLAVVGFVFMSPCINGWTHVSVIAHPIKDGVLVKL